MPHSRYRLERAEQEKSHDYGLSMILTELLLTTTIPIKLEELNFKVYTRFLSTFKKTVKKSNIVGTVVVSNSSVKIILSP